MPRSPRRRILACINCGYPVNVGLSSRLYASCAACASPGRRAETMEIIRLVAQIAGERLADARAAVLSERPGGEKWLAFTQREQTVWADAALHVRHERRQRLVAGSAGERPAEPPNEERAGGASPTPMLPPESS